MFYILVSRIPFVYNINNKKDKLFRTFLVGSICYIIVHGLLYSKKFTGNVFIEKYRNYLLYLAGIDFTVTSGMVYLLDKKNLEDNNDNAYLEVEGSEEDNSTIESNNHQKMTREQILQNFYRGQMMQQQVQQLNSPFINKADAEELKKTNDNSIHEASKQQDNKSSVSDKKSNKSSQDNNKEKNKLDSEKSNENNNQKNNNQEVNLNLNNLIDVISDTELPLYQPQQSQVVLNQ